MGQAYKIKIGDVVLLKSGGSKMTVEQVHEQGGISFLAVIWFDSGAQVHREILHPDMVRLVNVVMR